SLRPTVAAAMVRLAGIGPGMTVLDPFCGAGTILAEALDVAEKRSRGGVVRGVRGGHRPKPGVVTSPEPGKRRPAAPAPPGASARLDLDGAASETGGRGRDLSHPAVRQAAFFDRQDRPAVRGGRGGVGPRAAPGRPGGTTRDGARRSEARIAGPPMVTGAP